MWAPLSPVPLSPWGRDEWLCSRLSPLSAGKVTTSHLAGAKLSPLTGPVVASVSRDLQVGFWGGHPLFLMQLLVPTLLFSELGAKKRDHRQRQSLPWISLLGVCWLPLLDRAMTGEVDQVGGGKRELPSPETLAHRRVLALRPSMLLWCPWWGPSAAAGDTTGKAGQSLQQHFT